MLKLSHHTDGVLGNVIFNSLSKAVNHVISIVSLVKLLYYASVDDLETICCLFEHQETRLFPR